MISGSHLGSVAGRLKFVTSHRSFPHLAAWTFILCIFIRTAIPQTEGRLQNVPQSETAGNLYFIAAQWAAPFPPTLYRSGKGNKLERVRMLLPPKPDGTYDGYHIIRRSNSAVYIVSVSGGVISIVHDAKPDREDMVTVPGAEADDGIIAFDTSVSLTSPTSRELLVPFLGQALGSEIPLELVAVREEDEGGRPRLRSGVWPDYSSMEFLGTHGGADPDTHPIARSVNGKIVAFGLEHDITLDVAPAGLMLPKDRNLAILISSATMLALAPMYSQDELLSKQLPKEAALIIHNRETNIWSRLPIEGTDPPSVQQFGDWIAYTVGTWRTTDAVVADRHTERSGDSGIDQTVQKRYFSAFPFTYLPGVLVLHNVRTNRQFRISTGEEDSEILDIKQNRVLYRIARRIYSCRIGDTALQAPELISIGDEVSDIHWALWSK